MLNTKRVLNKYILQGLGLSLLLSAFFLGASFLSYDPADPSWNTVVDGPVQNVGGRLGAFLADLFMQFFGKASLFVVLALGVNGIGCFLSHKARGPLGRSFLCFLLGQLAFSGFFASLPFGTSSDLLSQGGALGIILHQKIFLVLGSSRFSPPPLCISLGLLFVALIFGGLSLNLRREDFSRFLKTLFPFLFGGWRSGWNYVERSYGTSKEKIERTFFSLKREPLQERMSSLTPQKAGLPAESEPSLFNLSLASEALEKKPEKKEALLSSLGLKIASSRPKERSFKEREEAPQPELDLQCTYQLPALSLLTASPKENAEPTISDALLLENAKILMDVLDDFGIRGEITKAHPGPVVTLYELVPAPGIKASRVVGLADDIARSMSALSTRIAVIPGHNAIGIELPNKVRQTVYLRELLNSADYETSGPKLPLALGKDIGGTPIIADLARMPHLLVAGTTGSGKSVAINTMILSLLYRLSPQHCRFIMIDPKMLELSVYDGIPHLLSPVVTEPKKAVFALKWAVKEMEDRYRAMSKLGVRNIEGYNARLAQALADGEELTRHVQTGFDSETGRPIFETQPLDTTPLPYIVVIVDEMADLMLVAGKDIEATVQRLAQMARAAGIHLIMATQRPSVDVITGTIKANFPTRISFQVTSRFDSRTILGGEGAEQLLGRGDMLYMEGGGKIMRIHGPFVGDGEVERVVKFLKLQGEPSYLSTITEEDTDVSLNSFGNSEEKGDALYQQAVQIVKRDQKASTSFIQRQLRIGYNTAARIIEQMESEGIVSPANHAGKREVLISSC